MKKLLLLPLFIFLFSHSIKSQDGVGIGRLAPHPSAVLHITSESNNKGVLFPYSSTLQISNISNPADGLFVYDSVFHRYAFRKNNTWMYLNPWDTEQVNLGNTTGDDENITGISTPYEVRVNNDLIANRLDGFGVVPIRGIIMWSGPVNQIPSNYEICDGGSRNGINIPNLVGRFVRGAVTSGGTGGTHTSATTRLSYIETPRFRIGGSDCSPHRYIYTVSISVTCEIPGEPLSTESFSLTRASSSCNAVLSDLIETLPNFCGLPGPGTETCSQTNNPNYYMTNPVCRNDDVREVDAITNTENRPQYYDLVYLIRVE